MLSSNICKISNGFIPVGARIRHVITVFQIAIFVGNSNLFNGDASGASEYGYKVMKSNQNSYKIIS